MSPTVSFFREARLYAANIRRFRSDDWLRYAGWIGSIAALFVGTTSFIAFGHWHGVIFPGYVFFIPLGTALFGTALAFDDIGHRTLYKEHLSQGEGYVHQMIVATAIPSVMALCLCYQHPETFRMPALALIGLSLFYSGIDELLHWVRYKTTHLDRVEMWSHFVAITGHVLMISCWWQWYDSGYPGVAATLQAFGQ